MNLKRDIREDEYLLILFLLEKLGETEEKYPINRIVEEYEGGKMGSISMGNPDQFPYDGDLIQANYIDTDGVEVVITLTKSTNNQLLDLDFWKVDFSKLLTYPSPTALIFNQ